MIRFTKSNWARFDSHGKVTTIRTKPLKVGWHVAMSGSRFKPERLGEVEVMPCLWTRLGPGNGGFKRAFSFGNLAPESADGVVWRVASSDPLSGKTNCCSQIASLDKLDAINDGFDSRDELVMELARLNKDLTPESIVWINAVRKIK